MIKSYHNLSVTNEKPSVFFEEEDVTLEEILQKKAKKLIAQLKTTKMQKPEKSRDLDWLIDEIEKGVKRNISFKKEYRFENFNVMIEYEKDDFLLIDKRLLDGTHSIRAYKTC